jgi:hypothetical protein
MLEMSSEDIMDAMSRSREKERSMRVSVQLPRDEVDRIVVNKLIEIRNSDVNRNSDMSHFDETLRHFLTEDEFEKHVVNDKLVEPR